MAVEASGAALDGRFIDILDLVPGMGVDEVMAGLAAHYAAESIAEQRTYFQAGSRGVEVKTVEFIQTVKSGDSGDAMVAFFTGPAAGNRAFAVERQVYYPDVLTAPTVATITEALISKYGAALQRRKRAAEADMQALLFDLERAHLEASKPAAAPAL